MKTFRLFLFLLATVFAVQLGFAQKVVNVKAKQFDTNLNISYDIVEEQVGQLFSVNALYSLDDGRTFKPLKSVKGDIGDKIEGGINHDIIWETLNDVEKLDGNILIKVEATGESSNPDFDDDQKYHYQIKSLHYDNNKLWAVFSIRNDADDRELKVINGKVTITDFEGKKYDAHWAQLGSVTGPERYSQPQVKMKPGEEIEARFRFDWAPSNIDRVRDISITFEALKFDMGVDYKKGIVKFRDLPVSPSEQKVAMKTTKQTFSGISDAQSFKIEKIVVLEKEKDINPPFIEISFPEGIQLSSGKQIDGRGVPVTHNVNNMDDGRSRAVPVTHNVNNMDDGRSRAVPVTHNVNNMEDGRQRAVPVTQNVKNMEDSKPRDLVSVLDEQITVTGKINDESSIYEVIVNGREAMLMNDGTFKCQVMLKEGTNLITIRAMDVYQNVTEQSFKLFRAKSANQPTVSSDTEDLDVILKPSVRVGKYYALIIAVNEYPDEQINDLNEPINDATKLAQVLVNDYNFDKENVYFLKNGTRAKVIDAFDFLNRKLSDKDNLLIFYAGHGYWDFQVEMGYWLPSDAAPNSSANWIRNSTIRDFVGSFNTKHTLLIADACFSGGIFKTRKTFEEAPNSINNVFELKSRKAMTSGNLTEVPDKSVFLENLVNRLQSNTRKYISAEELFSSIKTIVMNNSDLSPQYGDIKDAGDEGGDFVFIRREGLEN